LLTSLLFASSGTFDFAPLDFGRPFFLQALRSR
jgi:hypothetical protein